MEAQRRLNRPDFEGERRAIWLNRGHLQSAELSRLEEHLPVKISEIARDEFLGYVAIAVQRSGVRAIPKTKTKRDKSPQYETDAVRRDKLQIIAKNSRELLKALADLHPRFWMEIRAYSDEFAFVEMGHVPIADQTRKAILERAFLPHIWDTAQDIECIFSYAAGQLKPGKQSRPSESNARAFVSEIVGAFNHVTGKWPPYSKGTWFPIFMLEAGKLANLGDIGRDIVEAAVKGCKTRVR